MPIPMGPIASRRVKNDLLDIFELLDPGEVVLAKRRHGEVLVILTIHRTLAIGPDFAFSVLTGPEFPYHPALAPTTVAPASAPSALPEKPAGDVNAHTD